MLLGQFEEAMGYFELIHGEGIVNTEMASEGR